MTRMNKDVRQRIVEAAKEAGFAVQLKQDGSDLYDKNLVFKSRQYRSPVIVDKETGISGTTGDYNYLKVAVMPDAFKPELISPERGIHDFVNRQSGVNRHHSSNHRGFPDGIPGKKEPYGKCYKVENLGALSTLLNGLLAR